MGAGRYEARIWDVTMLSRSDKRPDRVEISPEQLAMAQQGAEVLSPSSSLQFLMESWRICAAQWTLPKKKRFIRWGFFLAIIFNGGFGFDRRFRFAWERPPGSWAGTTRTPRSLCSPRTLVSLISLFFFFCLSSPSADLFRFSDVRTQSSYQLMDKRFVGLIFSCFYQDKEFLNKMQITAFQSQHLGSEYGPSSASGSIFHSHHRRHLFSFADSKRKKSLCMLTGTRA